MVKRRIAAGPSDVCKKTSGGAAEDSPEVSPRRQYLRPPDLFYNFLFRFTYCLLCVCVDGLSDKDLQALFL